MSSGFYLNYGQGSDDFSRMWSCSVSCLWFAPCWHHSQQALPRYQADGSEELQSIILPARMCVWKFLVVSNFLWPHGLYSLWNSPGHSAGVGSLSLLQGIFPTQDWTQVSRIIGGFFTSWTTRIFLSQLLTVGSPRSNQDHKLSLELGMGSGTESPRVSVYEWFHKRTILVLSPEERGVLGWLRCGGDMRRTNQVWVWA